MTVRVLTLVHAVAAYLAFGVAIVWAVAFLADAVVPVGVDGTPGRAAPVAALVDAALLGLFAVQHTVMARAGFKRALARVIPPAAERSVFVMSASAVLMAAFLLWQPIGGTVWTVGTGPARASVFAISALGWATVVATTFMIDHLDFVGLRQAMEAVRGRAAAPIPFRARWLYALVRHPMMLGLLVAFWAVPRMTVGHLLFVALASAYIAVGLTFEERDLRANLGAVYDEYARRVPRLFPGVHRRDAALSRDEPAAGPAGGVEARRAG